VDTGSFVCLFFERISVVKKILAVVCMMAVALTFSMGSIGCGDKKDGTKPGSSATGATKTDTATKAETKAEAPK
jgi:hypothetical protein